MLSHLFNVGTVHLAKVRNSQKKHVDVHDMIEIRTDRFEHDLERIENLSGLAVRIRSREFASRWVYTRRSADGDEFANLRNMAVWPDWGWRVRWN